MCGIFGIIARNAQVPTDMLERATASLAHRGPDDSGTVIVRDSARALVGVGETVGALLAPRKVFL